MAEGKVLTGAGLRGQVAGKTALSRCLVLPVVLWCSTGYRQIR